MKKALLILITLALLLTACAQAETVITALAIPVNPDHLEKTSSYARILGYDAVNNTLSVELIAPEIFDREDVQALKVGDSIYTDGQEVKINTLNADDEWCVIINEGEYEYDEGAVYLFEDLDGNYRPQFYDDYIWTSITVLDCPVSDSLLFLDYIDPEWGTPLTLPSVHTAEEMIALLANETDCGLTTNNVYVTFDAAGSLSTVHRYYVSWQ